jgi:hypothetical protein
MGILPVILIGGALLLAVIVTFAIRRRAQCQRSDPSTHLLSRLTSLLGTLIWGLTAVIFVGFFACTTIYQLRKSESGLASMHAEISPVDVDNSPVVKVVPSILLENSAEVAGSAAVPLAAESTRQESELPDWARSERVTLGSTSLVVLKSKQYASPDQAEQEVLQAAAEQFVQYFHQTHAAQGAWTLPTAFLKSQAIKHSCMQTIEHDFGRFTGRMYRAYVQLKLSPEVREQAYGMWRTQIVEQRLLLLGRLVGFITLVLVSGAGYFRLDGLTKGACRGRLKLAAAAVVLAGGMAASWHLGRPPQEANPVILQGVQEQAVVKHL